MRIPENEKEGKKGGEKTRSTVSRESWPEKSPRDKKRIFRERESLGGRCTRAMDLQIFACNIRETIPPPVAQE